MTMESKKDLIEKYKELKGISDGKKPLKKDFLKHCNISERELVQSFGNNPYSKLQEECGDIANKNFKKPKIPLQKILDQYGNLVKLYNKIPVQADWVHADYRPRIQSFRVIHGGIKWSDMPSIFIKEYANKSEWKSEIQILKSNISTANNKFIRIVDIINEWTPNKKRKNEESYEVELRHFLEKKSYKVEEQGGNSKADLLINEKYPIEIKKKDDQSEYDRLLGQVIRQNKEFGSVIAVMINISSQDRFNRFQKLFFEIKEKLDMKAELIKK